MGLFDKLFRKKTIETHDQLNSAQEPEHAVIIRFNYGINGLEELHTLEERLEKTIENSKVGEYDGHEIAVDYSDGILYMYGPNAENLFKTVKPILEETTFLKGAIATLRFGPPGNDTKAIEIEI